MPPSHPFPFEAPPDATPGEGAVYGPRTTALFPSRGFTSIAAALFLVESGLRFWYKYLEKRTFRPAVDPVPDLINELGGGAGAFLLFLVLIYPVCVRFPLRRGALAARLPVHLAALLIYSTLHTSWNALSREALYRLVGRDFSYGTMAIRFPMEFAGDVFGYAVLALAVHAFLHYRELRDRELHAAELQARLSEAQLSAVRARLHPHFLFNTLNAIASALHRDPAAADRMLTGLSRLLREALSTEPGSVTTVEEERQTVEEYLDIMRQRFGDRLRTRVDVASDTRSAEVPPFLLQPLVENAIGHGIAPLARGGTVTIETRLSGAKLVVEVRDDGVGLAAEGTREGGDDPAVPRAAAADGVGLSATLERLLHLYGSAASLEVRPAQPRGTVARVILPYRERSSGPSSEAGTNGAP